MGVNQMNEQDIIDWNKKVDKLKEHIKKEFPNGCTGIPCDKCVFYKTLNLTVDRSLCNALIMATKK